MSAPTDQEALAALTLLREWLSGTRPSEEFHDQRRLPAGISRDAFLRLHRRRSAEGVEGWSRRGKARLVTASAWRKELEAETSRSRSETSPASVANDATSVDDRLDRELGIRTRSRRTG